MSVYSMNASYLRNTQRISGLSSGMDTEMLVRASMLNAQRKADTFTRNISLLTWQRDANREVNSLLNNFRNDFSTVTKQAQNMVSELTYKLSKVTLSTPSSAVSISANSTAIATSGSIQVLSLASAASATGAQTVSLPGSNGLSGTDTMEEVLSKLKSTGGITFDNTGTAKLAIGGKEFTIQNTTRFSDLLANINSADLGFKVSYSQLSDTMTVYDTKVGSESKLDASLTGSFFAAFGLGKPAAAASTARVTADGTGITATDTVEDAFGKLSSGIAAGWTPDPVTGLVNMSIGGTSFSFHKDMKFTDALKQINDSNLGITVEYNQASDTMSVTDHTTRSANRLNGLLEEDFFAAFNMGGISSGTLYTAGTDATALITHGDKTSLVRRDSNQFTIDGIAYSLNRVTNDPVEFSVERDVDGTVEAVKKYIEEYNKIIQSITDKLNERPNKKFSPLTDEERASLSADEIEKWESEAKKGLLYNNNTLRGLLSELRGAFYTPVGEDGKILANIGLTTTANYLDGGQIAVDEAALREALLRNPDEVYKMFAQQTNTTTATGSSTLDVANSGLVRRVNNSLYGYIRENEGYVIASAETQLRSQSAQQIEHLTKMYAEENRLYAKYAAMETALSKLSSQTNALSGMFSMGA